MAGAVFEVTAQAITQIRTKKVHRGISILRTTLGKVSISHLNGIRPDAIAAEESASSHVRKTLQTSKHGDHHGRTENEITADDNVVEIPCRG